MIRLKELTRTPQRFFDILPPDWRVGIEPFWPEYASSSKIYGLVDGNEIVAGGILFSTVSPDTTGYRKIAQHWLDKGYVYFGFLFVKENRRKEGLGSRWFKEIKNLSQDQKYWLAIDEYGLVKFYKTLGFEVVQEVQNGEYKEWILVEG